MSDNKNEIDAQLAAFLNGPVEQEQAPADISDQAFDALDAYLLANTEMDIEVLDGFLCALIVSPSVVPASEYLPVIFGGDEMKFKTNEEAVMITDAITTHWKHIEGKLKLKQDYYLYLCSDNNLKVNAWNWAYGFLLGTTLRREEWRPIMSSSQIAEDGLVSPILQLHWEANGQMDSIPAQKRDVMIETIIKNLKTLYAEFEDVRNLSRVDSPNTTLN